LCFAHLLDKFLPFGRINTFIMLSLTRNFCNFAADFDHIPLFRPIMSKEENYQQLVSGLKAIIEGETDMIAVMSNVAAEIHQTMKFWWTGFYRVKDGELILGPFQGPIACMHIAYGRGVCGTAWKKEETIIVPDVEQFPGHIACSSQSRSEIVVPVFDKEKKVIAVLDIDSEHLSTFDETDQKYLEEICSLIPTDI